MLEADCDAIAGEFEDLFLAGRLRLHPQSHLDAKKPVTKGDWSIFALYTLGLPDVGNLIEAPVTARVLGSMEDSIRNPRGTVFFSVLPPRTHIWAHCGLTNTRICLHLGLHIPDGATIRVGTETRSWEEGKCLVFDDSWEHEATNPTDQPRSVLLVDIWHPELSAEQRTALHIPAAEAVATPNRGWVRRASPGSEPAAEPIDPALFAILNSKRIERLTETARKTHQLDFPAVAEAARQALRVLAPGDPGVRTEKQPSNGTTDDALWTELAMLASSTDEHGFRSSDLIDIALLCSIWWRTWPEHADAMVGFLEAWPAAEKAACVDELVGLGTVSGMISRLSTLDVSEAGGSAGSASSRRPPFGALISLLCAAHRVTSAIEQSQ